MGGHNPTRFGIMAVAVYLLTVLVSALLIAAARPVESLAGGIIINTVIVFVLFRGVGRWVSR